MHPNLAAVYRRKVEELETLLTTPSTAMKRELIRSLIEKIELTPKEEGGLDALLHGDLARILALCAEQQKAPWADAVRGYSFSVVAGTGFEPVIPSPTD